SEMVYFAEDDYFYLPGRFQDMVRFLSNHPGDFVTPYDHPDYYTMRFHDHPNRIATDSDGHWRTVNSTCLTFMTTKSTLKRTRKAFLTYLKGNSDAGIWLSLTKSGLFNPFLAARNLLGGERYYRIWLKTWYFGWKRILFGKKRNIWAPVPSIATHMESQYLAPVVDWPGAFRKTASDLHYPPS
ncbi:MAG TPA: glycosyltransferase family 2 protein, partial [bacterium]